MKIELKKEEQDFKPITVNFTIENEEELQMCIEMFSLNATIPESISQEHEKYCKNFLNKIHDLLIEV